MLKPGLKHPYIVSSGFNPKDITSFFIVVEGHIIPVIKINSWAFFASILNTNFIVFLASQRVQCNRGFGYVLQIACCVPFELRPEFSEHDDLSGMSRLQICQREENS